MNDVSYDIVDLDLHFRESMEDLLDYFEEPWRTRLEDGGFYSKFRFYPSSTGDPTAGGRVQWTEDTNYPRPMAPEDIPKAMEFLGLDEVFVLSDLILGTGELSGDDGRDAVAARAIVEYLTEEVLDASRGIYSAIPIPYREPDLAVELIHEVGDVEEFKALYLVTQGPEPPLGNRRYEPIYAAAAEYDMPLVFHSGGSSLDGYHDSGYEKFVETHTLAFVESNMSQMTSLLIQGIPEKFPELDFVFLESGLFWVPMLMYRLDSEYMKRQSEAPLLERRPSEYMKEMYYGTQPLEVPDDVSYLKHVVEMMGGPERLLYASDYPHWDYDHPEVVERLPFLSESEKRQILAGTAREVFDL